MFIGHIGAGLALKRIAPQLNLGWLMLSSFLLDILLWCFVLFGIESVIIPANYEQLRYLTFIFPYSHGLLAVAAWAFLSYVLVNAGTKMKRFALAMSLGVISHWVLDLLIHPPEIPLFFSGSPMLGLSLWNNLAVESILEVVLLGAGLMLYYGATAATTFTGRYGMLISLSIISILAIGGQWLGPPPENGLQIASSSLGSLALLLLLSFTLDRTRTAKLL
ncbi:MAG: hypothetical protein JNN04_04125 [Cyclobacteriaceae bacterium]|nr:hypothetical protein [Cyclobacteriaceae bacterium]